MPEAVSCCTRLNHCFAFDALLAPVPLLIAGVARIAVDHVRRQCGLQFAESFRAVTITVSVLLETEGALLLPLLCLRRR